MITNAFDGTKNTEKKRTPTEYGCNSSSMSAMFIMKMNVKAKWESNRQVMGYKKWPFHSLVDLTSAKHPKANQNGVIGQIKS
jgi:hypothetical protein